MATKGRIETNQWLRNVCADIKGEVLSVGGGDDNDGEGNTYKSYFQNCSAYKTTEMGELDVRDMKLPSESYDCIFACAVIEHVDNFQKAIKEMTRVLKTGGILLINFAFKQPFHPCPGDYWRFTPMAIEYLLKGFEIGEIKEIDADDGFPSAYWVKSKKR